MISGMVLEKPHAAGRGVRQSQSSSHHPRPALFPHRHGRRGQSRPRPPALLALPLAALALRRWRDLLVWQGCQLVSWAITGWWLGDALAPTVTDDDRAYWLAILLRVLGLVWLVAAVLRDASGDDDVVEVGRGEAHADVDLLPDAGHPRA